MKYHARGGIWNARVKHDDLHRGVMDGGGGEEV